MTTIRKKQLKHNKQQAKIVKIVNLAVASFELASPYKLPISERRNLSKRVLTAVLRAYRLGYDFGVTTARMRSRDGGLT